MKTLTLLLLLIAPIAQAGTLALEWAIPTTGCTFGITPCDNFPLTGVAALTGIELYVARFPITDGYTRAPNRVLPPATREVKYNYTSPPGTLLYCRLRAVNAFGKSPFGEQITWRIP